MDKQSEHYIDFSQITDELYVGTNACCQMHFEEKLLKLGIVADISLEAEKLDSPEGVKYFLWLPTIDHTAPTITSLTLGVQMLHTLVAAKMKVYIHCKNGHGRAPTLAAAYFISKGMSAKKAVRQIIQKRPSIHIEPIQMARLEEFAQSLVWS